RRTRTNDGYLLARLDARGQRSDPVSRERLVSYRLFDQFDAHGLVVYVEHARRLAGRGANTARELGKVVGRVQGVNRLRPLTTISGIVPIGDQIAQGAARIAERNAAVHTTRPLFPQVVL